MKILVYLDTFSKGKNALKMASLICGYLGCEVTILSSTLKKKKIGKTEKRLKKASDFISEANPNMELRVGPAVNSILDLIDERGIDLVVTTKSKPGGRLSAATINNVLAQDPRISLLIVDDLVPDIKKILVCTGGTDMAISAIEKGAEIARAADAEVTLLYVAGVVPSMYTGLDEIEETLSELLQTETQIAKHLRKGADILATHNIPAILELRHGVAIEEIVIESEKGGHDLLIVGASATSAGLRSWLLGDITAKLIHQSKIPILVVQKKD